MCLFLRSVSYTRPLPAITQRVIPINIMKKDYSQIISFAFDLDGTLVDTENHKAEAHKETIEYFGGNIELDSYYNLIGNSFEYVFEELKSELTISITDYKKIFNKSYLEKLDNITLMDGAIELIQKIYSKKIKMALVTSSEKWMMEFILNKLKIKKYFTITVSANDVIKNKPNPEPYLKVINFLNSKTTYVFEDTKPGIISAKKAGAIVFGIKNSNNKISDLKVASRVYMNFNDFDFDEILCSI